MSDTAQSTAVVGGLSLATTTGFMVAAVLVIFILFVFVFVLYLNAKRWHGANPVSVPGRARLVFVAEPAAGPQQRGLDAAVMEALPSVSFRPEDFEEAVECAVCLCKLAEGEAARLLPKCNHAFHRACIDMWFYSHSTCPLCRSPVVLDETETADNSTAAVASDAREGESSSNSPANLFRASVGGSGSASVSSASRLEGALAIEIPRGEVDGFQTPSRIPEEDLRSPTAAALRSLRRLLSCGSRMAGDVEQGCLPVPKPPPSS
ncbi:RING-H2 finger protein [Musa troglodytarum]|uniref:RING-type E3 ubiquitin transferase n=1 Tax=Musa troglodytarum TaxID=320322 RepID=A0A9E7ELN7_9LILI|nr:RING-H2 finger protein [Musa troglodytarum]